MPANTDKAAYAAFTKALAEVKPSEDEFRHDVHVINELTGRLREIVPRDVAIRVVGSVVRGTQLKGDSDIDIFLLFSKKHSRDQITKNGLAYARKMLESKRDSFSVKYAEHPYTRLHMASLGVEADIVPAYYIDNIEDMSTAVDRSPMHADFINSNLTQKQRDDVRVLKHLLKANNLYGAEVRTSGFSGYLCELLVYNYGTLLNVIKSATGFALPVLLDPKSKAALKDRSIATRFNSQFVVIDPVDKDRNVAAGVSTESLARFVILCRSFLRRPNTSFFHKPAARSGAKALKHFAEEAGLDIYVVAATVPDKSEDVLWPQLRKVTDIIKYHAGKHGFEIYFSLQAISGTKGLLAFFAQKQEHVSILHKGPSAFNSKAQADFSMAHRKAIAFMVAGDTLNALERNKYANLACFMKAVAAGKVVGRRKDVALRGSPLFINAIPEGYAERIYDELGKKLMLP